MEISRPKSIFGKLPYSIEQLRMKKFFEFAKRGVFVIAPKEVLGGTWRELDPVAKALGITHISSIPIPIAFKRKKATEWFGKSKKLMNEMGV